MEKKSISVSGVQRSGGVSNISLFFLFYYPYIDICVFKLHPVTLLLDHPAARRHPESISDKKQINKCTWTLWRQQAVASPPHPLPIKRNSLGI